LGLHKKFTQDVSLDKEATLTFWKSSASDGEDPKLMNFSSRSAPQLLSLLHQPVPHPLAAVACSGVQPFIADDFDV